MAGFKMRGWCVFSPFFVLFFRLSIYFQPFTSLSIKIYIYFHGMEIPRSRKGMFVSQRKYVLNLLKEIGLIGCKAVETPIESNMKLQPIKVEEVIDRDSFQRLVGRLIYLSHTCPDIALFWAASL